MKILRDGELVDMAPEEIAALEAERNPPLGPLDLLAHAAKLRRSMIDAGATVTVGARQIPTWADAETQAALTALVVASNLNPALSTNWRGRDGGFYPVAGAEILELATGVMTFVQTAFGMEAAAAAAITANTATDIATVEIYFATT